MSRQCWHSFHKFMELKKTSRSDFPEMEYVYTLEPKQPYPRIHFNCRYSEEFVTINFHMDLSKHNAIYRHENLMRWHKTMNDYKIIYPNLIRLKSMRDGNALIINEGKDNPMFQEAEQAAVEGGEVTPVETPVETPAEAGVTPEAPTETPTTEPAV